MMLSSILMSMTSLFWVLVMMTLFFAVFGINLTQGVADYLTAEDAWESAKYDGMRLHFGRVDHSILTLFEGMSGGISWGELYDALLPLHWTYIFQFLFFIAFNVFTVVNVITGVFVTSALERAHDDKESLIQEKMT